MTITIKRYRNRKLYNTETKRYITLEQVAELVKDQLEIKVIDNPTGEDITSTTLSQIIFELEKNRAGFLPLSLLISLVQSGGYRLDEIRQNLFNSLNLAHHYDAEIERRVNLLMDRGDLSEADGNQLLKMLLSVSSRQQEWMGSLETRLNELFQQRQIPTKKDLRSLIDKIDDLSRRVDEINITGRK